MVTVVVPMCLDILGGNRWSLVEKYPGAIKEWPSSSAGWAHAIQMPELPPLVTTNLAKVEDISELGKFHVFQNICQPNLTKKLVCESDNGTIFHYAEGKGWSW